MADDGVWHGLTSKKTLPPAELLTSWTRRLASLVC
jgi:hypothetical protein